MKRGFYTIMAAQFFSSLADNALLIASNGTDSRDVTVNLTSGTGEFRLRVVD